MTAYVTGLREEVKALQQMGLDVADLKAAFSQISSLAAQDAEKYVPVRTGKLRQSIRGNKAKNKAVVTAGRASVPYAGPINYGWRKRNIRAANFMQKADEDISPRAYDMLQSAINDAIERNGL